MSPRTNPVAASSPPLERTRDPQPVVGEAATTGQHRSVPPILPEHLAALLDRIDEHEARAKARRAAEEALNPGLVEGRLLLALVIAVVIVCFMVAK